MSANASICAGPWATSLLRDRACYFDRDLFGNILHGGLQVELEFPLTFLEIETGRYRRNLRVRLGIDELNCCADAVGIAINAGARELDVKIVARSVFVTLIFCGRYGAAFQIALTTAPGNRRSAL